MPPKRFQGDQNESFQLRMRQLEARVDSCEDKHNNLVSSIEKWTSGFEVDRTKIQKFRIEFPGQMMKKLKNKSNVPLTNYLGS